MLRFRSNYPTRRPPSSPFLHSWTLSTSTSYSLSMVSRQTCLRPNAISLRLLLLQLLSPWGKYSPSHPSIKINPTRTIICASSHEPASVSADFISLCLFLMGWRLITPIQSLQCCRTRTAFGLSIYQCQRPVEHCPSLRSTYG